MFETVLIAAAIAWVSLPALAQTNDNSRTLADCVQAADQKYKNAWKALCARDGKSANASISWDRRAIKNFTNFASKK
jgi:hypothetical protein